MPMDSHLRSIVKAMSWRVLATMVTFGVTYACTGNLSTAALVGSLEALCKIGLFLGARTTLAGNHMGHAAALRVIHSRTPL